MKSSGQIKSEGDSFSPNSSLSGLSDVRFHLGELRGRIIKIAYAIILGFIAAYSFSDHIISFMERPLLQVLPPGENHLYYMGLMEKFFIYMKWSAYVGTFLVSPYILFQVWSFISPGLYEREKKIIRPFLFAGFVAFFIGMAFSYTFVLPYTFKFLVDFGAKTEKPMINLSQYFSLAAQLVLTTAILFELPVVLVLLGSLGILKVETLTKYRKHAHVGLSVVAAVITPMPDAISMILVKLRNSES
ncbi:MAG: twin-arginine translocase subunit TatC [Deltaproteobacteria bacterium]|nr:twin-arginine translocase subunit TatC [Deltaproteobacteria bacterium]